MTCEELRPDYGAYALGVAGDPERSEITEHLEQDCPLCVPGVRSALATVTAMSGALTLVKPPKSLRKRVVAMVSPEPPSRWAVRLPWALSAVLAIVLLSIAIPSRTSKRGAAPTSNARFEEVLSILSDPVTKEAAFGEPAARGRFFVSPGKGIVFIAAHLPKLDPGRTFEMWVIPPSGKPVPAGTFQALPDSTAVHVHPGPVENAAAMAISVEPSGGSPQPTTTPIVVTRL